MLKVKEYLDNNNLDHNISNILDAIKATNTNIVTIEMNTGRKFIIEHTDKPIKAPELDITIIDHVFVDGIYYKEEAAINVNFISCIY